MTSIEYDPRSTKSPKKRYLKLIFIEYFVVSGLPPTLGSINFNRS